jgi:hypothetical protein
MTEKALDQFVNIFHNTLPKLAVGLIVIAVAWMSLTVSKSADSLARIQATNGLRLLSEWSRPLGSWSVILFAALLSGDVIMLLTRTLLRGLGRLALSSAPEEEHISKWPLLWQAFCPFSHEAMERFEVFLETRPEYVDIPAMNRSRTQRQALIAAHGMSRRVSLPHRADGSQEAEEGEALLRVSLAPWVWAFSWLAASMLVELPLSIDWAIRVGGATLSLVLLVYGWFKWRESQSQIVHGLCESQADLTDLLRRSARET